MYLDQQPKLIPHRYHGGFTLIEMIVVMVITGILGGMVALFIRGPVQGYVDSARRAGMTDIADTALSRITRDIRTAAPNSVWISAGADYLEFVTATGPATYVTYVCAPVAGGGVNGTLTRYWGYAGPLHPNNVSTLLTAGANHALLASNVGACNFVNPVPRLVTMQLTLTESGESISLYGAAHVANVP